MESLNFVVGEICSLFEIIIVIDFICSSLGWKEKIIHENKSFAILTVILFGLAQSKEIINNGELIIVIADLLIITGFSCVCLNGELKNKILTCIMPFLLISLINIALIQVVVLFCHTTVGDFIDTTNYAFIIAMVISKVIFWVILNRIKNIIRKLYLYLSTTQVVKINILIIYTIVMEMCILYMLSVRTIERTTFYLLNLISLGILLLNIYVIHSIYDICKQNERLMRMNLVSLQNQENERRIKELEDAEQRIKKLHHDYKNHCVNMKNLLRKQEFQQLEAYLNKMTGEEAGTEQEYVKTKCPIIDAVLNTKIYQGKLYNIDIFCYVLGNLKINGIEVASILFNLLDNAIEASKNNKSEKTIICQVVETSSDIDICIKNHIENSVLENNSNLDTKKTNKENHGLGLKIVKEIVENMQGIWEIYEEENMFCVHIYLPTGEMTKYV